MQRSSADPALAHFAARASRYAQASARWPWSWVRAGETRAVFAALGDVHGLRVLEIGCGAGHYTRRLVERGAAHVWAVDPVPAMIAQLPIGDVTGLVARGDTFELDVRVDRVLIAGALEFMADPGATLRHAARHTASDGRLVLLAPRADFAGGLYRASHARGGVPVRLFSAEDLETLGVDAGWSLVRRQDVAPFNHIATFQKA